MPSTPTTGGGPIWHDSFINPAAGITTVPTVEADYQSTCSPRSASRARPSSTRPRTRSTSWPRRWRPRAAPTSDVLTAARARHRDRRREVRRPGGDRGRASGATGVGHTSGGVDARSCPNFQIQRPGLLLLRTAWCTPAYASLGDHGPYHGWIIGSSAQTLQTVAAVQRHAERQRGRHLDERRRPRRRRRGQPLRPDRQRHLHRPDGGQGLRRQLPEARLATSASPTTSPRRIRSTLAAKDLDLGSGGRSCSCPTSPAPRPAPARGRRQGRDPLRRQPRQARALSGRKKRAPQLIPNPGKRHLLDARLFQRHRLRPRRRRRPEGVPHQQRHARRARRRRGRTASATRARRPASRPTATPTGSSGRSRTAARAAAAGPGDPVRLATPANIAHLLYTSAQDGAPRRGGALRQVHRRPRSPTARSTWAPRPA